MKESETKTFSVTGKIKQNQNENNTQTPCTTQKNGAKGRG